MVNRLTCKLEAFGPLPEADRFLLDEVIRSAQAVGPRTDLIREGQTPSDVNLILEGFACRYKVLPTGRRQIMAYLVPGDFCDLHVFILKTMDHGIATLSACTVVKISRARILELMERPAIAKAFWWAALVDEATLREWLVNVGARKAEQRVAHLLCELLLRLRTVGLTTGNQYELPITQAELADTVGLTGVHVNRILQRLRADGLITLRSKNLVILDEERLKAFSNFNPNYLHLAEQDGLPEQCL
ncbi:Crp/Fnr family transcriptional regulator [Microvirga sp. BT689]|uniref:Crp/Fnr family transcriptional regulator n=1 Tax=Microvirga arvi TaxID=2778731 RepID=UPI0019506BB8|nr:Crp/Fnr family transcriptional regulator [Microvirga arvi]MBM6583794.1 Crp/Fnr family transcriptional regulator [Microvirga arvi]